MCVCACVCMSVSTCIYGFVYMHACEHDHSCMNDFMYVSTMWAGFLSHNTYLLMPIAPSGA